MICKSWYNTLQLAIETMKHSTYKSLGRFLPWLSTVTNTVTCGLVCLPCPHILIGAMSIWKCSWWQLWPSSFASIDHSSVKIQNIPEQPCFSCLGAPSANIGLILAHLGSNRNYLRGWSQRLISRYMYEGVLSSQLDSIWRIMPCRTHRRTCNR